MAGGTFLSPCCAVWICPRQGVPVGQFELTPLSAVPWAPLVCYSLLNFTQSTSCFPLKRLSSYFSIFWHWKEEGKWRKACVGCLVWFIGKLSRRDEEKRENFCLCCCRSGVAEEWSGRAPAEVFSSRSSRLLAPVSSFHLVRREENQESWLIICCLCTVIVIFEVVFGG